MIIYFYFSCVRLRTEFPEHSFYNPSFVGLPMVMTAYHWQKLPELIGNSRVQAEVRPTFTLKNCKRKETNDKNRLYFFINDENRNREMVQKA